MQTAQSMTASILIFKADSNNLNTIFRLRIYTNMLRPAFSLPKLCVLFN